MSSIPTRRATRTTRTMKDTENAVVRSTRATSLRAKSVAAASSATTRATAPTAASKAKVISSSEGEANVGKRKREALAEVSTGGNKLKAGSTGVKGKEKDVATAKVMAAEPAATTATTTTTTRVFRRAGSAAPSGASRIAKPKAKEAPEASKVPAVPKRSESKPPSAAATKVYRDEPAPEVTKQDDVDDGEARRAVKRRHMDAIVEAPLQEEQNASQISQIEADKIALELTKVEESIVVPQPEEQLWEDLDADDYDDPLMVSEYVVDVCKYWKKLEVETLPDPDYMDKQTEINWEQRGILVDWLIQVHNRFNLLPESLFLTVNLLDRFLSLRPISLAKLQLVGLTAFFIATKFEETCAPSVTEIVFLSDNQYQAPEVLRAEMYLLRVLDWDLRNPGPLNWLRRGSKADDCDTSARTVAKYLLEIGCLEKRLIGVVPSLLAAAALWIGRLVVGRCTWTPNLEHYTTYSEKEIYPIATIMLEYVLTNPIQHDSLYNKYAHKKYMKCSAYMRQWALERWPENSDIHLEREIDAIKEDIQRALDEQLRREIEEEREEERLRRASS